MDFIWGKEYKRTDIHKEYRGQQQGGISTPKDHPYIFIFSGEAGDTYGYEDHWSEDKKLFYYTGEGQVGDMQFNRGNRAIRDHAQNNKWGWLISAIRWRCWESRIDSLAMTAPCPR